ncbi:hypothetical protein MARBORIA2_17900 [Methanobrevibacter arboriphilus]|jgi:hypothetical protein|uniref:Uncharacterized protein n=1 Tax=Methanobrevibacter arboriphilus TaxID=39441 RepID=A0ACA8R4G1_METAZ|nr:hypothetical protein [Methanobrevibacter arboriphilus]BBL62621.1 hypothetical protein MarbSA_16610 [Methanobrevibacter arboriphilus]GLI12700.1 hypothetical protein MARBORIA2_17900 [Methanobrevibacter arboriphilus]
MSLKNLKIPHIPYLNFNQDKDKNIIFQAISGVIKSTSEDKKDDIFDIKLVISNDIKIYFSISLFSTYFFKKYGEYEEDKKNIVDGTPDISFYSNIYFVDSKNRYDVKIKNFFVDSYKFNFSGDYSTLKAYIVGVCEEIVVYDNDFSDNETVESWEIIENTIFSQPKGFGFKNIQIEKLFLKGLDTNEFNSVNLNKKCINQFKYATGYFYYKDKFKNLNKWDKRLDNIYYLLAFYNSDFNNRRITLIEGENKTKMIFRDRYLGESNGKNIFEKNGYNLFNLIDSTYSPLTNLELKEIDFKLLIEYFIYIENAYNIKNEILFSSIFLEILKNQYKTNNDSTLLDNLKNALNVHELNSNKLFEILHANYGIDFKKIEKNILNEYKNSKDRKNILKMFAMFKSNYFLNKLKLYRNNIVHTGKMNISVEENIEIIDEISKYLKKSFNGNKNEEILDKISNSLNDEINSGNFREDFDLQQNFLKEFIIIILLAIFDVNCNIKRNTIMGNNISRNSIDYLNQFK